MTRLVLRALAGLSFILFAAGAGPAVVPADLLDGIETRCIGPANTSGRVTSIAIYEPRSAIHYVAAASGGVWKTVNNGITFTPIFDDRPVASIGAVAVCQTNPDIVWVGTGEANARNSVSWGDGIYKSTDGGKTWKNVGLRDTHHIGKIVLHPRDPDTVYVAALGHLWGPNKERGIFKTADGGKNWANVLFINEDIGGIDLEMDPADPEIVYANLYRVRRDAFAGGNPAIQFDPLAGLYKTANGGRDWARMTKGLPDRPLGRCGIAVARKNPQVVYAVVQTDQTNIKQVPGQPPASNDKPAGGGVFRSADRGETWAKVNDLCPRPFYFGKIRVDPLDEQRVYVLGVPLFVSLDGGKTFRSDGAPGAHPDNHALWIDPADPLHLILGTDGGVYYSYDRGANWEHVKNLPIAQFYAVGVDHRQPYRVYGGLQDNGSWAAPSRTRTGEGITVVDWFRFFGADGFQCQIDPRDPDTIFTEGQYGMLYRVNLRTGSEVDVRPRPPRDAPAYRFNWNAPILLSPHEAATMYCGGNYLFRSVNRGQSWDVVGPDLTHGKPGRSENTGHALTTIAESPVKAGVLYTGSDDGRIHISRDGGKTWDDASDRLGSLPRDKWITRLECSPFAEGTAWVTIDRHRNDDRAPYLFRTDDFGASWKSVAGNLPVGGPLHVVRADPRNRDLLFVGSEFGLFATLDGGISWRAIKGGLPTVAVHDLAIHPRERELVIATHGRGIFIADIAPLQELSPQNLEGAGFLFEIKPAWGYYARAPRGISGGKNFLGRNPPYGASVHYWLRDKPASAKLTIADVAGNPVAELPLADRPGMHRSQWNLRPSRGFRPFRGEDFVKPGEYIARLKIGEQIWTRKFQVLIDD